MHFSFNFGKNATHCFVFEQVIELLLHNYLSKCVVITKLPRPAFPFAVIN